MVLTGIQEPESRPNLIRLAEELRPSISKYLIQAWNKIEYINSLGLGTLAQAAQISKPVTENPTSTPSLNRFLTTDGSVTSLKDTLPQSKNTLLTPRETHLLSNPSQLRNLQYTADTMEQRHGQTDNSQSMLWTGNQQRPLNQETAMDNRLAEQSANTLFSSDPALSDISSGPRIGSGRQTMTNSLDNINGWQTISKPGLSQSVEIPTTLSTDTSIPSLSSSITTSTPPNSLQSVISTSPEKYLEPASSSTRMDYGTYQPSSQPISSTVQNIRQMPGDGLTSQQMDGITFSNPERAIEISPLGTKTSTASLLAEHMNSDHQQLQSRPIPSPLQEPSPEPQLPNQQLMITDYPDQREMSAQEDSTILNADGRIVRKISGPMNQGLALTHQRQRWQDPQTRERSPFRRQRVWRANESGKQEATSSSRSHSTSESERESSSVIDSQSRAVTPQPLLQAQDTTPLISSIPKSEIIPTMDSSGHESIPLQEMKKAELMPPPQAPAPRTTTMAPQPGTSQGELIPYEVENRRKLRQHLQQTAPYRRPPRSMIPVSTALSRPVSPNSLNQQLTLLKKSSMPQVLTDPKIKETSEEAKYAEMAQHINTGRMAENLINRVNSGLPINNERSLADSVTIIRPAQDAYNQGSNAMNQIPTGNPNRITSQINDALTIAKRASTPVINQVVKRTVKRPLIIEEVTEGVNTPSVSQAKSPYQDPNDLPLSVSIPKLSPPTVRRASVDTGVVDRINAAYQQAFRPPTIPTPLEYEAVKSTENLDKKAKIVRNPTLKFFGDVARRALGYALEGGLKLGADYMSSNKWTGDKRIASLRGLGPRDEARHQMIKIPGDRPGFKKIVGDAPVLNESLRKIPGDAPVEDPHLKKIPGDAPMDEHAIDTEIAGAADTEMADAHMSGYYTSIMAGIKFRSATNTVSMTGSANSYSEMLNRALSNSTMLNLKYGESDIPNVCFIPGMSIHLAATNFYQREGSNENNYPAMIGGKKGRRCVWQMNWTTCPASIPLSPGFDLENLQAVVAVGGTQTMFSSTIKNYSSTFFNADVLQRLMQVAGDTHLTKTGYSFMEPLLRHCMDIVSKYPVPGDELSQLCDPIGWTFADPHPQYWIPRWSVIPFTHRDKAAEDYWSLQMRMVGYDSFAKQLIKFPDAASPWDANWTMDKFWPNCTDEFNSVAVVYCKASELSNPMCLLRRMLNRLQWPYCMKMYKLVPFIWDFDKSIWTKTKFDPFYHNEHGHKQEDHWYGYQVAHNFYIPGPVRKVLFVVIDYLHDDNLSIDFSEAGGNGTVNTQANSPYVTFKGQAQADRIFPFEEWTYITLNNAHWRSEFDTSDTLEMIEWENTYGAACVSEGVNMIVRNVTALWGMPKYIIPPHANQAGEMMGYLTYKGIGKAPEPWKGQSVDEDDWGPVVETTLNDCGYSVPTGYTDKDYDGWHERRYEEWFDFPKVKFNDFNYTVYHRHVLIDFLVERGFLYLSVEANQSRVSESIFGYVLSIREQGVMWAGLIDGMRQINNQQWNNIYYSFLKWPDDPRVASITQCIQNQDEHILSALIGCWDKFTVLERPFWNLKAKMPKPLWKLLFKFFFRDEFMKKSICPIGRVSHFVMARYDVELAYSDTNLNFSNYVILKGAEWNMFRNLSQKQFIDLVTAWAWGHNSHNRMLRKVSMSYFPGCNTSNTIALIGMQRPQEIVLFPFLFIPPCSGLCFILAYSAIQDYTYSLSGPKYASIPLGYQLNSVNMARESTQFLAFIARAMITALSGNSLDYKIVLAPTSIEGFITDIVPPVLMDAYLFKPFPNALDSA
nr:TPA_asm: hypothetical protein [Becan tricladivirus 2]